MSPASHLFAWIFLYGAAEDVGAQAPRVSRALGELFPKALCDSPGAHPSFLFEPAPSELWGATDPEGTLVQTSLLTPTPSLMENRTARVFRALGQLEQSGVSGLGLVADLNGGDGVSVLATPVSESRTWVMDVPYRHLDCEPLEVKGESIAEKLEGLQSLSAGIIEGFRDLPPIKQAKEIVVNRIHAQMSRSRLEGKLPFPSSPSLRSRRM